jgi:hypothetical protein
LNRRGIQITRGKAPTLHPLDHLVCGGQQRLRDGEAERLGGLEVDHQLEPGWLLNRQIGGFFTLENPAGVDASLPLGIDITGSITHQAAGHNVLA